MNNPIIDILPVTPAQRGLLIIERAIAKKSLYHERYIAEIKGKLDKDRLQSAWQKTVEAHTILRTIFDWDGQNDPVQVVLRTFSSAIHFPSDDATRFAQQEAEKDFALDTVPPYHLALVETNDEVFQLIFTYHHILLDGTSVATLMNHFIEQYNHPSPSGPVNDYGQYVRWLPTTHPDRSVAAWKAYIDEKPLPQAPVVNDDDITNSYTEPIDVNLTKAIIQAATNNHVTLNSVFQVAWAHVIAKQRNQQITCIGSPVTFRPLDGSLDGIVGLCINTIPYAISFDGSSSLAELVAHHQRQWGGLIEHSSMSLSDIKKAIGYRHYGDPFDTILTYTDSRDRQEPHIDGATWKVVSHNEITQYALSLDVVLHKDWVELKATYRDASYNEAVVKALFQLFIESLQLFVSHPEFIPIIDQVGATEESEAEYTNAYLLPISTITNIWSTVFNMPVESDANFFELGGDSISALRIVSKIQEAGGVISMRDVFDHPTPAQLAQVVSSHKKAATTQQLPEKVMAEARALYRDSVKKVAPASNVQSAILNRSPQKDSLYHDQSTFTYQGDLNVPLFEQAWNHAIQQNSSLRMSYFQVDQSWFAATHTTRPIKIAYKDIASQEGKFEDIKDAINDDLAKPFQLATEPLIRLKLYKTHDHTYVLFLSFHLLVTDGWSFAFMMDDVFSAYEQLLARQSVSIKERHPSFEQYLHALTDQDIITGRQHWQGQLQSIAHNKPPTIKNFSQLEQCFTTLTVEQTLSIQKVASMHSVSVNSLVQAAWAKTIVAADVVVFGATTSGRLLHNTHYDETIGLFFNDIPVIARPQGKSLVALAHVLQQDFQVNLQYSSIASYEIAALLGRGEDEPPYDSLVVFENYPKVQEESLKENERGGLKNSDYWRRDMADIPETLYVEVMGDILTIKLSYHSDIVSNEAAEKHIQAFKEMFLTCIESQ